MGSRGYSAMPKQSRGHGTPQPGVGVTPSLTLGVRQAAAGRLIWWHGRTRAADHPARRPARPEARPARPAGGRPPLLARRPGPAGPARPANPPVGAPGPGRDLRADVRPAQGAA